MHNRWTGKRLPHSASFVNSTQRHSIFERHIPNLYLCFIYKRYGHLCKILIMISNRLACIRHRQPMASDRWSSEFCAPATATDQTHCHRSPFPSSLPLLPFQKSYIKVNTKIIHQISGWPFIKCSFHLRSFGARSRNWRPRHRRAIDVPHSALLHSISYYISVLKRFFGRLLGR